MRSTLPPILVALPLLLAAQPASKVQPEPLVLTGITVIDATGTPAQPGMTVLIKAGRIAEVGNSGSVAIPAGARVVDGRRKYLIPGLWDMHVHWYDEPSLPVFVAQGVTGIRIMCGYPVHLRWRTEIEAGRLVGPRMVLAGPIVDGPQPVWPDSIRAADRAQGQAAVRQIENQGYDCVKVYNPLPRSAYFGVAAEAKRLGLPLVGHVPFAVSAAEAADAGQKSLEHLSGVSLACSSREAELRQRLLATVQDPNAPTTAVQLRIEVEAEDSYDATKASELWDRFVRNRTWQVPTLIVRQAHGAIREKASATSSQMRYLPESMKSRWESRRAATLRRLGPEDFMNFKHSLKRQLKLVRAMHNASIPFLAGTDTGALDCYPGFSLHDELELLVRGGLSPLEALQAATRNPARFLGRLSQLGTVEKGKAADLVLLDANPLDDIRNTTKIHAVVVNGRLFEAAELRKLLDGVEAACKRKGAEKPPGNSPRYP
jgi:imidazolonepropionase-like amidohydrolase